MENSNIELSLTSIIKDLYSFIKNNKRITYLAIVFSLIASTFFYFNAKPYYETHMTAYSDVLSDAKLADLFADITELVEKKEYDLLSLKLKIPKEKLKSLKKLTIDYPKDESSLKEHFGVKIKVKVLDAKLLSVLENALVKYIDNMPFIKNRIDKRQKFLKVNISTVQSEIKSMSILRDNIIRSFEQNSLSKDIYLSDVGVASTKIIELSQKEAELISQLESLNDLQIIKSFNIVKTYTGPNYILVSFIITTGSLILFNLIYFLLIWIKKELLFPSQI